MKPGLGYLPEGGNFPFKGINVNTPPSMLDMGESPNAINLEPFRGSARARVGYSNLGGATNGTSGEHILACFPFDKYQIACTPTSVYALDTSSTSNTWTEITSTASKMTGTNSTFIDHAEGVDMNLGKVVVFTNGIDKPFYWTGTGQVSQFAGNFTSSGITAAGCVAIYHNYLIFGAITTSSGLEPRTVVWSDTGDFNEWLSGNSSVLTELPFQGTILRMALYNQNLAVFTTNSIGCLCYIDPQVIFGSQTYVTGIKIASAEAVSVSSFHAIFVGADNVYLWQGGSDVVPIGDKITPLWRTYQSDTTLPRTKLFYDVTRDQIRFMMPTSATESRIFVGEIKPRVSSYLELEKASGVQWYEYEYPIEVTCFGISNLNGKIKPVLGSTTGTVWSQNTETTDSGTSISVTFDTPDFVIPEIYQSQLSRWLEFEFAAIGVSADVYYSINAGSSWTQLTSQGLSAIMEAYKDYLDVTSRYIRFRIQSTVSTTRGFELGWYRVWFRPGGAR